MHGWLFTDIHFVQSGNLHTLAVDLLNLNNRINAFLINPNIDVFFFKYLWVSIILLTSIIL